MAEGSVREFLDNTPGQPAVRGFLHLPAERSGDTLILTHGAGSNARAPLLVALGEAFCDAGYVVLRCDLPFRQMRQSGPPVRGSAERDQEGIRRAVELMRAQTSGRVILGGHSYGGRQASILAAAELKLADALLLLSYPLHPPNRPEQMRTAHFPDLRTPALFVHGKRDGFATHEELAAALTLIPAKTQLLSIDAVGHELLGKRNRETLPGEVVVALRGFLQEDHR